VSPTELDRELVYSLEAALGSAGHGGTGGRSARGGGTRSMFGGGAMREEQSSPTGARRTPATRRATSGGQRGREERNANANDIDDSTRRGGLRGALGAAEQYASTLFGGGTRSPRERD